MRHDKELHIKKLQDKILIATLKEDDEELRKVIDEINKTIISLADTRRQEAKSLRDKYRTRN